MSKNKSANEPVIEPIGHIASNIYRMFLVAMNNSLAHLDIDRFFYPITLIENAGGTLTQQELADKLKTDKAQVVRIIDYLSENGYVIRSQNSHDRRKHALKITEKAKRHIPEIREAIKKANEILLNNLSEEKILELYSSLKIIENNISSYEKSG